MPSLKLRGINVVRFPRVWSSGMVQPLPPNSTHEQFCDLCHKPGADCFLISAIGERVQFHQRDCKLDFIWAHEETTERMPFPHQLSFAGPLKYVLSQGGIQVPYAELSRLPHQHDPPPDRAGMCWASEKFFDQLMGKKP